MDIWSKGALWLFRTQKVWVLAMSASHFTWVRNSHFTMAILINNGHSDQIHNSHHNSQSFWRVLFAKMHCERKMTWKESRCTVALLMKIVIKHSYHLYNRTIIISLITVRSCLRTSLLLVQHFDVLIYSERKDNFLIFSEGNRCINTYNMFRVLNDTFLSTICIW